MQEYKICPFCGKATDAALENCTHCAGLVKFAKSGSVNAAKAAAINDPDYGVIKPVGKITEGSLLVLQCASMMTAVLFFINAFTVANAMREPVAAMLVMILLIASFTGTWIGSGNLLKKFNAADIARPLINMNFYFLGAVVLTILLAQINQSEGGGFFLALALLAVIISGAVLFIISASRMVNSPNPFIPLPVLGKVIIYSFCIHILLSILTHFTQPQGAWHLISQFTSAAISASPFLCLAWVIARCRKKLLLHNINPE